MKQRISYFLVSLLFAFCFSAQAQIPAPSEMTTLDDFSDGNFNANPQWNVVAPSNNWTVSGGQLLVNQLNGSFALSTPFNRTANAWQFDYVMDGGFAGQFLDYFFFMTGTSSDPRNASGYRVRYQLGNTSNVVSLQTVTNGVVVNTIASFNNGLTNALPRITITRNNNTWEFYVGSTLRGTGIEGTYSNLIGAYQGLFVFLPNSSTPYNHGFDNIRFREITFGPYASAVFLGTCRQPAGSFFNTTGDGANLIDQNNKTFTDTFFGTYIQNSGALILKGAEVKTFRGTNSNVCIPKMYYRIIPQGSTPGTFSNTDLSNIIDNCSGSNFPTGGPCNIRDQKWQRNDLSVDLTALPPGNYTFQVYYEITGSTTSPTTGCGDTIILNNGGNFYNSTFVIQSTPVLSSTNPTTCSGTNGTITIKGAAPNTKYAVTYNDNGVTIGPDSLTSNASGDIVIAGLNAGTYTSFSISNACTIPVNGIVTLSDPSFSITPSSTPNTVCNGTPGGETPCTYTGPKVVINEIMVMPGVNYSVGGADNTNSAIQAMTNSTNNGQEWVELYNPSPCDPVDLSCYILGAKTIDGSNSASFSFPSGTIIQPLGFLVIGATNAPSVNINLNTFRSTQYLVTTSRWHLSNSNGYLALYDKNLSIVDGIYWAPNQNNINTLSEFNNLLSPPNSAPCGYSGVINTPRSMASSFEYVGDNSSSTVGAQTIGKSTYRQTDGSNTWIVGGIGATNNTPGNCNGLCAPPFNGGGTEGTCDGSVSVVVTGGVGTLSYSWTDQSNNSVGTTSSVSNLCAGTYSVTVTDNTTNCSKTATVTVTDNIPQVTPLFTQVAAICSGGTFTLPTTSTNNITGSWSPAIDNTQTRTYTFTPDPGQCATTTTMTVTVNPSVTPLFTQVPAICSGGTFTLPTTSTNNITGSWLPAIDNTQTQTYTFTPDPGQCATTTTMTVTVSSSINPIFSFNNQLSLCNGRNIPVLPGTSDNGISGTWNPSVISNTQSNSYVFTPTISACATPFTLNVTITTLTPTVSSTPNTVCNGTGGTPGGCVPSGTGVVINEVRPWPAAPFSQGLIGVGGEYIELYNPTCSPIDISCYIIGARSNSTTSTGGSIILPRGTTIQPKAHFVIGTSSSSLNPASVDFKTDQNTAYYCATGNFVLANSDGWVGLYDNNGNPVDAIYWTTFTNESNKVSTDDDYNDNPCTPTSVTGCSTSGIILSSPAEIFTNSPSTISYVGQTLGLPSNLPTSPTGKTFSRIPDGGSWQRNIDPSIDGSNCNNGQCDVSTPGTGGTCNGSVSVTLGGGTGNFTYEWRNSSNNVIGSGSTVSNLCAGTYTVKITDVATGCDSTVNITVADNVPQITPSFNTYGPYCQGDILPTVTLPDSSNNGIKGTWNPSSLSTAVAGDISYTFTPNAGQCADPVTIIVKVNPRVTPEFPYGTRLTICSGDPTPNLLGLSSNNILGTWNPSNPVSNTQSNVYTFTPLGNACANQTTFTVTVIQRPNVTVRPDTALYHNAVYPGDIFRGLPSGSTVSWTNSDASIGLPLSGNGNIPAFTAVNTGSQPVTATITVNSTNGNCGGEVRRFKITVLPLNRDVFVPNVFTPNGDGRNDQLFVFGNYITKLEMRIFNQWGEMIKLINNPAAGWDGTHNGKPQPVGVYVYTLRATLADGTEVNKKGSISLVR